MFKSIKNIFSNTSSKISSGISSLFTKKKTLDAQTSKDLETLLILSDMGVPTTQKILATVKKVDQESNIKEIKSLVRDEIFSTIDKHQHELVISCKPFVFLVSGVNGNGKTTTIGKLANFYKSQGYKIHVAACDTYRAAAVEQLKSWCDLIDVPITIGAGNSDPASVAYKALEESLATDIDILFIDTAGRLHNRDDLMAELEKISRVIKKLVPEAPHENLLIIDSTTGQTGMQQASIFLDKTKTTGLVLTKLDGTAKGGIAVNISDKFHLPIFFIGYGEGIADIKPFDALEYANNIMEIQ